VNVFIIFLLQLPSSAKEDNYSLYAFNKFATSLADACLNKGDFAAFCSACICEKSQYQIKEGCHRQVAHIGIPEQPSTKIFARKPHVTVRILLYLCLYDFEGICANCAVVGLYDMT
jgi:hypothetical protein